MYESGHSAGDWRGDVRSALQRLEQAMARQEHHVREAGAQEDPALDLLRATGRLLAEEIQRLRRQLAG